MDGASLVVGRSYALREHVSTGAPSGASVRRCRRPARKDQDPPRGRAERGARGVRLHPEHHRSVGEVRALLRDEKQHAALVEHLSSPDRVIRQAADTVITSSGEDVGARRRHPGRRSGSNRSTHAARRARAESLRTAPARVRRPQRLRLRPFPGTEALARASQQPNPTPSPWRSKTKAEWKHGGQRPHVRYLHDPPPSTHTPAFAVAPHWAGFDSEIRSCCEEIGPASATCCCGARP